MMVVFNIFSLLYFCFRNKNPAHIQARSTTEVLGDAKHVPPQITEQGARLFGPTFGPLEWLGYSATSLFVRRAKPVFLQRKLLGRCFGSLGGLRYLGTAR